MREAGRCGRRQGPKYPRGKSDPSSVRPFLCLSPQRLGDMVKATHFCKTLTWSQRQVTLKNIVGASPLGATNIYPSL